MKISRPIVMLVALCAPLGCVSSAQAPSSPQGFEAFRILGMRNIFNPLRQPLTAAAVARPQVVEQPRRATDYVTLTGVMVTGAKTLAFFNGSRPDYDKVLEANGEIAGAKVTKITPAGIEVDRSGKKISVAVGQTVPFDGSAPGAPPASPGDSASVSAPADASPPPGAPTQTAAPLPGNLNEVMRQMMERRQQELK